MVDLKKEIKFSDLLPKRKPKDDLPEVEETPKEKKPKSSFLKKDLSFKRKPKAARETGRTPRTRSRRRRSASALPARRGRSGPRSSSG